MQDKLAESEAELATKKEENRTLREAIRISDEKLSILDQTQHSSTFVDNSDLLKSQIEELTELLTQEADAKKQHEETMHSMEKEFNALREILAVCKKLMKFRYKRAVIRTQFI